MTTAAALGLDAAQFAHVQTIVSTVQSKGLPQRAAVICLETAIVESGIRIDANPNVPSSEDVPHEGEGEDHASVGIYQQQVPSWGTTADCMDPVKSTLKFLYGANANPGLLTLPGYRFEYVGYPSATSWTQIPTGAAAQAVQVSAEPGRYQLQEARATQIVDALWSEEDDMAFAIQYAYKPNSKVTVIRIADPYLQTAVGFDSPADLNAWKTAFRAGGGVIVTAAFSNAYAATIGAKK